MEKPKSKVHQLASFAACAVLAAAILPANAELMHRWSFNNPAGNAGAGTLLTDSLSATAATVRGNGSRFTGSGLTIPGNTNGNRSAGFISGYIDLPNGIISSKTHLTVEVWAAPSRPRTKRASSSSDA